MLSYAPNQAIAHRGLVETLPSVEPLVTQPDFAPYVGTYVRPSNSVVVRSEGGKLLVQERPNTGTARRGDVDRVFRSGPRSGHGRR